MLGVKLDNRGSNLDLELMPAKMDQVLQRALLAADGYLDLGMPEEAAGELDDPDLDPIFGAARDAG